MVGYTEAVQKRAWRRSIAISSKPTLGQTSAGNIQFGLGGISRPYCSFACSSLASLRTGMSGSASFQSSRNSK